MSGAITLEAFSWSKDLAFRTMIFDSRDIGKPRSPENLSLTDPSVHKLALIEHDQVESITKALFPHLARCQSLNYNVYFKSSLPSLQTLLPNICIDTPSLRLSYTIPYVLQHASTPFHVTIPLTPFSQLSYLCLPAVEIVSVGRIDNNFWSSCKFQSLELELYNYDFCSVSSSRLADIASTNEFFSYVMSIEVTSTTLRDFSICEHHVHDDVHGDLPHPIVITHLKSWDWGEPGMGTFTLENLTKPFLESLFKICSIDADTGYIKNCSLPGSTSTSISCNELTLNNLPIEAEIVAALDEFEGVKITFQYCKFLNDKIFRVLAKTSTCFSELEISDSDRYSIQALKYLYRAKAMNEGCGSIMKFPNISGTGPQLTEEDREWFLRHCEDSDEDSVDTSDEDSESQDISDE